MSAPSADRSALRRDAAPDRWLVLQLADGTFPSGGFAHSAGLEAATVLGAFDGAGIEAFLDASLRQIGRASLPFVRAAADEPARLAALDDAYDATLPMVAPNRASRAQGRALASAAARVWDRVGGVAEHARLGPAHHAPVFGAVFGALGVSQDDALAAYLHGAARGILSAGVRLGLIGPLEAQRLHAARAPLFGELVEAAHGLRPEDAAQTAPLIEIFAALHERLDGRMFQS
ncbi:MAG: urease accessory protein UreF [Labilithrix sp.]|nr:urease accessory protein UreF [Labilithrix sp.]